MTSKERSYLRKLAQPLKPVVMVGKTGVDERVIAALNAALEAHELLKVKFQAFHEERRELATALSEASGSTLVSLIGHVATFYRQHSDPKKREIFY